MTLNAEGKKAEKPSGGGEGEGRSYASASAQEIHSPAISKMAAMRCNFSSSSSSEVCKIIGISASKQAPTTHFLLLTVTSHITLPISQLTSGISYHEKLP